MPSTITVSEFDLIRRFIEDETSIALADDKVYLVESRLGEIMKGEGLDGYSALHQALLKPQNKRLKDRVLDAMTTNETLWFRDSKPFDVFRDVLLPSYLSEIQKGQRQKIRIWSAACSSGQEPYSLAMTFLEAVHENQALKPHHLEIIASDFSDEALATAKAGRYGKVAISRGLPAGFREKYFHPVESDFEVSPELKQRISFRKFNLQDSFITMGSFDIILTRYVLIYFTDDFKKEVLRKAHGALNNDGVVFLGSSECLPLGTKGYSMVRSGQSSYFQKIGEKDPGVSKPLPAKPLTGSGIKSRAATPAVPATEKTDAKSGSAEKLKESSEKLADIVLRLQELHKKNNPEK